MGDWLVRSNWAEGSFVQDLMTSAQLVKGWSTLLNLALNDKQGLSSAGQKCPTGVI